MKPRHLGVLLTLGCLLFGPAELLAGITGFSVNKIEGVGDLEGELDERLTDDNMINYDDCLLYLGEYAADTTITGSQPSPRFLLKWSLTSVTGYDYSIKVGSCSDTAGLADEESDSCKYIVTRTSLDSFTNNELYVDFVDLLPDGCQEGDTGETAIYFFVQYEDDTTTKMVETVKFSYDFEPPSAPTGLEVEEGENNLKLSWEDKLNSDDITYKVYWLDAALNEESKASADSTDSVTSKSYQIDGLEVGVSYFVAVAALDEYDNESELSVVVEGTPVEVQDFWESYKASGGQEEGGYCFVATAASGSGSSFLVTQLRSFRDASLVGSAWGRALVEAYYRIGPDWARFIADKPGLRFAVRTALLPVALLVAVSTTLGTSPGSLFLALGIILAAMIARQRQIQRSMRNGRCS